MLKKVNPKIEQISEPTDSGNEMIAYGQPFIVSVTVEGSCDLILHAWNSESVDEKARAAKNSKAKKTDNVESYVYRNESGEICLPGSYLRGIIINAAKFRQDPRSSRKSAQDLYKAGITVTTILASLGKKKWDYLDRRRVVVHGNAITRTRPAIRAGWQATFEITIGLPEYIDRHALRDVIEMGGRLVGFGDFRPTYGRYGIVKFK